MLDGDPLRDRERLIVRRQRLGGAPELALQVADVEVAPGQAGLRLPVAGRGRRQLRPEGHLLPVGLQRLFLRADLRGDLPDAPISLRQLDLQRRIASVLVYEGPVVSATPRRAGPFLVAAQIAARSVNPAASGGCPG